MASRCGEPGTQIVVVELTVRDVLDRADDLVGVYRTIYALPRAAGLVFERTLHEHALRDGFRLCVAQDPERDALVGFGYGFTGRVGQVWRDSLALALDRLLRDRWLTDYFELAEFGILPDFRRRGIGGRLHDRLLADLPHPRSVLTVRANNAVARRFYRRRRWQILHEGFFSTSGRGPYIVMGHTLARTSNPAPSGL
jgi:ribosomal protein S18 acetylase RimI-like enzyme